MFEGGAIMKVTKTVYDSKVIDIVYFDTRTDNLEDLYGAFETLSNRSHDSVESGNGKITIKVVRPLSQDDRDYRLGVVAKKLEKEKNGPKWRYDHDYAQYLRLKARFGD